MTETKKYELRKLSASDIFPMSRIIGKIGIKEFGQCFDSGTLQKIMKGGGDRVATQESVGLQVVLDIAGVILSNLVNVEKELFAFLSSVGGLSVSEVRAISMADFAEMIIELVQKEEFKDFFRVASGLFK